VENNIHVVVPKAQVCCGAFQEHLGLDVGEALRDQNIRAFDQLDIEAVVCNSSGCGLALAKSLKGRVRVCDITTFLGERDLVRRHRVESDGTRVYVDLPCHLIHGQRVEGIPNNVLDATGYRWELAPQARDCCGSGGVYNIEKPENARQILAKKSAFLNAAEGNPVVLATSNHVCMMQWYSARRTHLVQRDYHVRHIVQLLDS
jgi:glycolate oxidase iron-sulfur subunit